MSECNQFSFIEAVCKSWEELGFKIDWPNPDLFGDVELVTGIKHRNYPRQMNETVHKQQKELRLYNFDCKAMTYSYDIKALETRIIKSEGVEL